MKSKSRLAWIVLPAILLFGWIFHNTILTALGDHLVADQKLEHADVAVVLGGGADGRRVLKAAELTRQGVVPVTLVSGPGELYGNHECDLAIPFAVKHGYPESYFLHFENNAHSTVEEAAAIIPELRRRGFRKILLVTSTYHSARAGKVFRRAGPDLEFRTAAATDPHFTPDGWWRDREGQKVFLVEWMKTVADWVRL